MKQITILILLSSILVLSCGKGEGLPEVETPEFPEGTVFCSDTKTAVVEVLNPMTGKTWMDRNLGATRVARSSTDENAYGDYYQWGRFSDGHQCKDSNVTSETSTNAQPEHGDFIRGTGTFGRGYIDWINIQKSNLWQGSEGINNPCPKGYRLPTWAEWDEERRSWASDNADGAFNSPLKLTMAGRREPSQGSFSASNNQGAFDSRGEFGEYWSSTVSSFDDLIATGSRTLLFANDLAKISSSHRAQGSCIRCIKD